MNAKLKPLIFAAFFAGVFLIVRAVYAEDTASRHWEFSGWYGGGCYPNVEFDPATPRRVYLTSDVAGMWRSEDLGDHWTFINRGLQNLYVAQVAAAPGDAQLLYAGTAGGLFYSLKGGAEWSRGDDLQGKIRFKRPGSYRAIAVDPKEPSHVCVGSSSGGIFCSNDHGEHWTDLDPENAVWPAKSAVAALAFTPSAEALYAAGDRGMGRFDFRARQWRIFEKAPQAITDFVFSKKSPEILYAAGHPVLWISKDGGNEWYESRSIPQGALFRLAWTGPRENRLIAGWKKNFKGGVLWTDDEGQTWTPAGQSFSPDTKADPTRVWAVSDRRMTALKADPFHSQNLFLTDWWGVWRSEDGGASWNEKIVGAPNTVGSDIAIDAQGRIYAASMDDGLLKSEDGGKTYEPLFPSKGYKRAINGHVWRVLVSPDGKKILATSSPWEEKVNQVALSEDGGKSFEIVREGLPAKRPKRNTMWSEGYPRALARDPRDPEVLYLGIDGDDGGGLYISRNGGKTWTASPGQPDSRRIYKALGVDAMDPQRIFWGACGKDGGIYVSEDGGISWKRFFSRMKWVFDLAVSTEGNVYAGGDEGGPKLYVSYDHGSKWELLKAFGGKGTVEAITVDPKDPKRMAISTVQWGNSSGGTIYLTRDWGKHWEDITGDLPAGSGAAAMSFDPGSQHLYLIRYAGSVYRLKL